jgi:hypothetical protein
MGLVTRRYETMNKLAAEGTKTKGKEQNLISRVAERFTVPYGTYLVHIKTFWVIFVMN